MSFQKSTLSEVKNSVKPNKMVFSVCAGLLKVEMMLSLLSRKHPSSCTEHSLKEAFWVLGFEICK